MILFVSVLSILLLTFPLPLAFGQDDNNDCNCTACDSSSRMYLGAWEDIVSPTCPEGFVATVESLESTDDNNGGYLVQTRNTKSSIFDTNPYVYRQASFDDEDVTCFAFDPSILPIVGDQSEIQVSLNCEAFTYCDFRWNAQFGCVSTGVTFNSDSSGYQVLSDVEDTIACSTPSTTCDSVTSCTLEGSITEFLAGVDRRLERNEMYPGVAELQLGLSLGPNGGGRYYNHTPAKPIILSARPREAEFFLGTIDQDSDLNTYFEFTGSRNNYSHWGMNVDASMYGSLFDGTDHTEIGQTKAQSYEEVVQEHPNTRYVFLGDNGQGDVCAAQSMLESQGDNTSSRQQLAAVLIHVVQEDPSMLTTNCKSPNDNTDFTLNLPESEEVHYFRTYSNATLWSLDKELISCHSATMVYNAIEHWYTCRCSGEWCPPLGLPTGGTAEQATREETLDYCLEVELDQVQLGAAVEACNNPVIPTSSPTTSPTTLAPTEAVQPGEAVRPGDDTEPSQTTSILTSSAYHRWFASPIMICSLAMLIAAMMVES